MTSAQQLRAYHFLSTAWRNAPVEVIEGRVGALLADSHLAEEIRVDTLQMLMTLLAEHSPLTDATAYELFDTVRAVRQDEASASAGGREARGLLD
jgi:hypothetical protein